MEPRGGEATPPGTGVPGPGPLAPLTRSSGGDAHDLVDRFWVVDDPEHEVGDVSPRDQETAPKVVAVRGAVAAGAALVGETGRADDGPVEPAVAHDILHRCQVAVLAAERPLG